MTPTSETNRTESVDRIEIRCTVERHSPRLPRYVIVRSSTLERWRLPGTTTVEGRLQGISIGRRSLKRWDDERWFIDLPEGLCDAARIDTGDRVELSLWIASQRLPDELADLLAADAAAKSRWDRLTDSQRRMLREHVAAAKLPATRARRAKKALK